MAGGQSILVVSGFGIPVIATVGSMIAGTMFGIWMGQLISESGIPNQGLSLIIFSGIVSRIPVNLGSLLQADGWWWLLIIVVALLAVTVFAIVFVQEGQRNVPVLFPGRRVGNRMSMPVRSSVPLRVNMAGMIPLIFAQTLLSFPAVVASYFVGSSTPWIQNLANGIYTTFGGGNTWYILIYFFMVVAFTFFYTQVLFEQQNYGDSLKKQGAHPALFEQGSEPNYPSGRSLPGRCGSPAKPHCDDSPDQQFCNVIGFFFRFVDCGGYNPRYIQYY